CASLLSCTASLPSHLARASRNLAGSANPCDLTFLATLPGLLTRARFLFCNLAGSAYPCELTFLHRKFAEPPRSCLSQPCRLTRASLLFCNVAGSANPCELTFLAILPGLLTRASLLFDNLAGSANLYELTFLAILPGLLTRASLLFDNLAGSANLYELTFLAILPGLLTRASLLFDNLAGSANLYELTFLAILPGLLTRASLLFDNLAGSANLYELTFLAILPGLLTRASLLFDNLAGSANLYELTFLAILPGLLTRASLLFDNLAGSANLYELTFLAILPGLLTRASLLFDNLAGSANLYELTFLAILPGLLTRASLLFDNLAGSANLYELTFLAILPGLLTRASLLFDNLAGSANLYELTFLAILPGLLTRASLLFDNLAGSANLYELTFLAILPGLLTRASLLFDNLAGSANLYELTFLAILPGLLTRASLLFDNLAGSANLYELTFLAILPGLLTRASLLFDNLAGSANLYELTFLAILPGLLTRASLLFDNLAGSANLYELTFLAILPGLLTRASLLSCTASSPSHLARASCNLAPSGSPSQLARASCSLAGSANPCELTFLQPCWVCLPVRAYFSATLLGLLTRASLLFCNLAGSAYPCELTFLQPCWVCLPVRAYFSATLLGLLTRASLLFCNLAGSAYPCELTFLQPCWVCLPVRAYFSATLLGLLTRASLLFCNLAGSAYPCELTFLQPCWVCLPVRAYFSATLLGLLTRASLLFCNLAGSAYPCELTFLQPCWVCLPVRAYFSATLLGLLTRASLLFCNLAGSAYPCELTFLQPCWVCLPVRAYFSATLLGLLTRASLLFCNLAGSAYPCELTFFPRRFAEPPRSCLLQPCRGLLTRASLLSYNASSPSYLARASRNLAGSNNPCELTFLRPCRGLLTRASLLSYNASSPSYLARASRNLAGSNNPCELTFLRPCRVRRATSLVPLATLPGLRIHASLLSFPASSPSHLAHASCNLAGSANPCELTFLQPCQVCESMRAYFLSPQVRRATSLVPLATLPGLLTPASLLFCNLAGSNNPCELTFLATLPVRRAISLVPLATLPLLVTRASLLFCNLAGSANPSNLTFLQPCWVCLPVRAYFPTPQVRRAISLVPLATLPLLVTRASLLFCNLAGSANPSNLTFLQPCWVCLPVRAYFPTPQVRRAISLVPLATLPLLVTRASLLFCNLAGSANPSNLTFLQPCWVCLPVRAYFPTPQVRRAISLVPLATLPLLVTRASLLFCNLAGSANPSNLTFLQPCWVCLPVRAYFPTPQVRRAISLVPLATLPLLVTRASLLFCNLAGSANPSNLTFLQPCWVCLPVRAYFPTPQVRRAISLVPLATLPLLVTRASLLFCNLAGSANPSNLTFLQPCWVCLPVRAYFPTPQVRRAISLVPLATLPLLVTRASLLFCNLAGSANPSNLTFLQPCWVCLPVRAYFPTPQVRRAISLVPLATLPLLVTRASLLFCNLAGSANPSNLTFLQPCWVCLPVRAYFPTPQVRRAISLVPLATLPLLVTRASLLFCNLAGSANPSNLTFLQPCWVCLPVRAYFPTPQVRRAISLVPLATLPLLVTRASLLFCNLAGSANPSNLTFLQPCWVCLPVRAYFPTPQVRRAISLVPLATLPLLVTRASLLFCNLAGSANPSNLTFLQPCWVCLPVRAYFPTPQVRRAISLVPLATLPLLVTRASLLFCNLAGSANPSNLTFLQPCWVCLPVRAYFPTPQVRRAISLVPLATLPLLVTRASLLFCNLAGSANPSNLTFLQPCWVCLPVRAYFPTPQVRRAISLVPLATLPLLVTRASLLFCNLAGSANPSNLTFLQPCWVCLPVRAYFPTPQVRRAISLVPLATLPLLVTRASLLFCNLARSANPCELTFFPRKFAEPPRSCLLQPCRVC
ncbi:hypothetical protein CRG98_020290, partial [Punica granatum]